MSCHLTMLSEKIEESLGNPLFPHSCFPLPSSSPFLLFPILFSFFLFMIYCFVPFYLIGGHLGRRWGSCGSNCYFLFVIAFYFGVFTHSVITFTFFVIVLFVSPSSSCHCRPCNNGPYTSGVWETHHPSWRCYPLPHRFGGYALRVFQPCCLITGCTESPWRGSNPSKRKEHCCL